MNGIEIKIARIRKGLLQYEVAAKTGISPNRLSEIETGRREPSAELLNRIVRILTASVKEWNQRSENG